MKTTTRRPEMTDAKLVRANVTEAGYVILTYRLADGSLARGIKSPFAPEAMVEWLDADYQEVK